MTIESAITVLEQYNRWRKGADIPMPKQNDISEAIDFVVQYYRYGA